MEREKKVIDASVVIKWFVNEEYSDKALLIKNRHVNGNIQLVAPELLIIEVLNALRYKGKNIEELKTINSDLIDIQIKIERLNKILIEKALKISLEDNFSIYDSIYIALAQIHGTKIITDDRILKNVPSVSLLKDI